MSSLDVSPPSPPPSDPTALAARLEAFLIQAKRDATDAEQRRLARIHTFTLWLMVTAALLCVASSPSARALLPPVLTRAPRRH